MKSNSTDREQIQLPVIDFAQPFRHFAALKSEVRKPNKSRNQQSKYIEKDEDHWFVPEHTAKSSLSVHTFGIDDVHGDASRNGSMFPRIYSGNDKYEKYKVRGLSASSQEKGYQKKSLSNTPTKTTNDDSIDSGKDFDVIKYADDTLKNRTQLPKKPELRLHNLSLDQTQVATDVPISAMKPPPDHEIVEESKTLKKYNMFNLTRSKTEPIVPKVQDISFDGFNKQNGYKTTTIKVVINTGAYPEGELTERSDIPNNDNTPACEKFSGYGLSPIPRRLPSLKKSYPSASIAAIEMESTDDDALNGSFKHVLPSRVYDLQLHHGTTTPRFRQTRQLLKEENKFRITPTDSLPKAEILKLHSFDQTRLAYQLERFDKWYRYREHLFDFGFDKAFYDSNDAMNTAQASRKNSVSGGVSPDSLVALCSEIDFEDVDSLDFNLDIQLVGGELRTVEVNGKQRSKHEQVRRRFHGLVDDINESEIGVLTPRKRAPKVRNEDLSKQSPAQIMIELERLLKQVRQRNKKYLTKRKAHRKGLRKNWNSMDSEELYVENLRDKFLKEYGFLVDEKSFNKFTTELSDTEEDHHQKDGKRRSRLNKVLLELDESPSHGKYIDDLMKKCGIGNSYEAFWKRVGRVRPPRIRRNSHDGSLAKKKGKKRNGKRSKKFPAAEPIELNDKLNKRRTSSARGYNDTDILLDLRTLTEDVYFPSKEIKIEVAERRLRRQREKAAREEAEAKLSALSSLKLPPMVTIDPNDLLLSEQSENDDLDSELPLDLPDEPLDDLNLGFEMPLTPKTRRAVDTEDLQHVGQLLQEMRQCRYIRWSKRQQAMVNRLLELDILDG